MTAISTNALPLPRGARLLEVRPLELGSADSPRRRDVNGRTVVAAPARPDAGRRAVVDALEAGGPLHAIVWLWPLPDALRRGWAAAVLDGSVEPFDAWLRSALGDETTGPAFEPQDAVVDGWASLLGAEGVTALVVDEADPDGPTRAYEALLGTRDATVADGPGWSRRTPTFAEIEVVRAFNAAYRQLGLDRGVHRSVVRDGMAAELGRRVPGPDEAPPV
ncbi:MAG TPA: hypothetical protein VNL94_09915, partial [Candidatus Binatia bacterium]|nr:hypothetical protein [Candidatus Binatia bacterium]